MTDLQNTNLNPRLSVIGSLLSSTNTALNTVQQQGIQVFDPTISYPVGSTIKNPANNILYTLLVPYVQNTGGIDFSNPTVVNQYSSATLPVSASYNAATDTPPLSSLAVGYSFIVTTAGRIPETVTGATCTSGGSFLCVGDVIQCTAASTYKLLNPIITTAPSPILIGTLSNTSSIYFINLGEAVSYIAQRRINANQLWSVTFDPSYESTSYTNPDSGSIYLGHPDSSLITYTGNAVTVALTANTASSGSIQNQSVTYTAAANSLVNNTWVTLYNETTSSAVNTLFVGNHSGTWQLTSGGGTTSLVLNNLGRNNVTFPGSGDTNFSGATLQTSTNIHAQLVMTECDNITVGNIIAISDANSPILICASKINFSSTTAVLGIGSTHASLNTGPYLVINNATFGGEAGGGVLSLKGGYSTTNTNQVINSSNINVNYYNAASFASIHRGGLLNVTATTAGNLQIEGSVGWTTNLYGCNSLIDGIYFQGGIFNILTNLILNANASGGIFLATGQSGGLSVVGNATVNSNLSSAVRVYGSSLSINNLTTNSNNGSSGAVGVVVRGGIVSINNHTANNNANEGLLVQGGSVYIANQSYSGNGGYGTYVSAGDVEIITQTSSINHSIADNYVQTGALWIGSDNSGISTAPNHYLTDSGLIQITGGTNSVGTGSVSTIGIGQIVKTGGASTFNTAAPAATAAIGTGWTNVGSPTVTAECAIINGKQSAQVNIKIVPGTSTATATNATLTTTLPNASANFSGVLNVTDSSGVILGIATIAVGTNTITLPAGYSVNTHTITITGTYSLI